ncbi:MAG: archaetidylserine decarboxylase [Pseudomonadaceae bacterium]|nr:archaetidylserine decarboxylase [Pseudomonadaceae bacterium]
MRHADWKSRFLALSWQQKFLFLVTNQLPRRSATLLMGRLSKVEQPLVKKLMMALWQMFADDLRLFEAKHQHFKSMHDCFVREIKPEMRPIDNRSNTLVSPCDAVIGEYGPVCDGHAYQIKGAPYRINDLFGDEDVARRYAGGNFCTLRLKSSMYHHFHAPWPGVINEVVYISGDTWNVNPPTLKVIDALFCKNERAVVELKNCDQRIAIVAVAAILVASIRVHGLPEPLNLNYRGPNHLPLKRSVSKGEPLGYFEHGSTLVLFAPKCFEFSADLKAGEIIRMGEPLMQKMPAGRIRPL